MNRVLWLTAYTLGSSLSDCATQISSQGLGRSFPGCCVQEGGDSKGYTCDPFCVSKSFKVPVKPLVRISIGNIPRPSVGVLLEPKCCCSRSSECKSCHIMVPTCCPVVFQLQRWHSPRMDSASYSTPSFFGDTSEHARTPPANLVVMFDLERPKRSRWVENKFPWSDARKLELEQ